MESNEKGRSRAPRLVVEVALLCLVSVISACRSTHRPVLTLSVAASLQDSITEIESAYQRDHPVEFRNNFGASGTLAREIEQGAPVDAFISAGTKPMDQLQSEDLLFAGSRVDLLRNSLVLIAPRNSILAGFEGLTADSIRTVALGDPASVPAGQYGKQTLENLRLYDRVKAKLVLGKDVRQVLTYVETGDADAGLVYATDAQISKRVQVVAVAPDQSHDAIVYPIASMKASQNQPAVHDFIRFLTSPEARAVFERHGFRMA